LFSDYWQRFLSCLSALKEKHHRTVYRLTLVKSFNMEEIQQYAQLIQIGQPTLIEIKGVTFCGETSAANQLTMKNVPFHHEVRLFSQSLCDVLISEYTQEYAIACEHEHSCCVLIASTRLRRTSDKHWMTWINYDKFHDCMSKYYDSNGLYTFNVSDYWEETPDWAIYGNSAAGFNPDEQRVKTKGKNKTKQTITTKTEE